ncbi:MAG: hypothetical protein AB8G86_16535 [Saprospiraceae bacterium]
MITYNTFQEKKLKEFHDDTNKLVDVANNLKEDPNNTSLLGQKACENHQVFQVFSEYTPLSNVNRIKAIFEENASDQQLLKVLLNTNIGFGNNKRIINIVSMDEETTNALKGKSIMVFGIKKPLVLTDPMDQFYYIKVVDNKFTNRVIDKLQAMGGQVIGSRRFNMERQILFLSEGCPEILFKDGLPLRELDLGEIKVKFYHKFYKLNEEKRKFSKDDLKKKKTKANEFKVMVSKRKAKSVKANKSNPEVVQSENKDDTDANELLLESPDGVKSTKGVEGIMASESNEFLLEDSNPNDKKKSVGGEVNDGNNGKKGDNNKFIGTPKKLFKGIATKNSFEIFTEYEDDIEEDFLDIVCKFRNEEDEEFVSSKRRKSTAISATPPHKSVLKTTRTKRAEAETKFQSTIKETPLKVIQNYNENMTSLTHFYQKVQKEKLLIKLHTTIAILRMIRLNKQWVNSKLSDIDFIKKQSNRDEFKSLEDISQLWNAITDYYKCDELTKEKLLSIATVDTIYRVCTPKLYRDDKMIKAITKVDPSRLTGAGEFLSDQTLFLLVNNDTLTNQIMKVIESGNIKNEILHLQNLKHFQPPTSPTTNEEEGSEL